MDLSYTYDALASARHIRILTLVQSEDVDATLECSIDQLHIDDPIKEYEAISYTWGDQGRTERLVCDGATIKITPNLAAALLCLRYRTRPRRLWADAVCINQEDLTEKGQQIPLMGRIFQNATQVRVWLGHGAEGESKALADLSSMKQIAGPTRSSLKHPLTYENNDPGTTQALVKMGRSAKKILRMSWFTRCWIVQELVLNGNVVFHCGQSQISWQGLHVAFHALPPSVWDGELDTQIRRKLGQFRDLWRTWCYANEPTVDCSIYSLLHSFHDLEYKEPKDKIYAIAGLADDVELKVLASPSPPRVASIAIDYMASDEQVFQDLAFRLIQSGKVFGTLAHAAATRVVGAERQLPSWVPDVRHPGPWPLIASELEGTDDFELLKVCEPSNGILTLRIRVYCWPLLGRSLDSSSWPRPEWRTLKTRILVKDVLQFINHSIEPGRSFFPGAIAQRLTMRIALIAGTQWHNTNFTRSVLHMLWSITRSQLLTEDGPDSLGRLPAFEEWKDRYWNPHIPIEDQWSRCLARASSTRTIFVGECQRMPRENTDPETRNKHFFGFGPCDVAARDLILVGSSGSEAVPALFLRRQGAEHKVIGGGFLWVYHDIVDENRWELCHIEVRLI